MLGRIAPVHVDHVSADAAHRFEEEVDQLRARRSLRVSGEQTVRIEAVDRVDVRLASLEARSVDQREQDHAAADPVRVERSPQPAGCLDRRILGAVHPREEHEAGSGGATVDDDDGESQGSGRSVEDRDSASDFLAGDRDERSDVQG